MMKRTLSWAAVLVSLFAAHLAVAQTNLFIPIKAVTSTGVVGIISASANNISTVLVQATGNGSGLVFSVECSANGTNTWVALPALAPNTGVSSTSLNGNGSWLVSVPGCALVRVNVTAISGGTESFSANGAVGSLFYPASSSLTPVTPAACAWTYTSVTLAAATSATILAAGSYKAVVVMNMGANPLNRFASGTSPITASSPGFALDPPSNVQGGSYAFPLPPTTAVQAISTLGTTVTVGTCS